MASGHPLEGPLLFTPQVFGDDRGFFYESWNERRFCADLIAAGIPSTDVEQLRFRQDNPPVPRAECLRSSFSTFT